MRNGDYIRRKPFEYIRTPHTTDGGEDNDLPTMPPPDSSLASYGQANIMPILILHSEPLRSTLSVPSGFFSSVRFSDNIGGGGDDDVDMGGTQGSYD